MLAHLFDWPRGAIEPVGPQCIPNINNRKNTRHKRDLLAFQAERVAGAVPLFMVGTGNVQSCAQVTDRGEHFVGKDGVFFHDNPFSVGQSFVFEQNLVRNTHLADVVQQRAPADLHQLRVTQAEQSSQLDSQGRHALRVPFGLVVAQFQCPRPAFDGGIVCRRKLPVGTLQIIEQGDVVDGNGSLGGKGFQEVHPFFITHGPCTMKNFKHTHYLSFRNQRHSMVADEVFAFLKFPIQKKIMFFCQIRYMDDTAFQCDSSGITFSKMLGFVLCQIVVKAAPGHIFQRLGCRVQ